MNPNIRFQLRHKEVSVFKLDTSVKQLFHYEICHEVNGKLIYCCTIGSKSVELCEGDYIVIYNVPIYLNGVSKYVEHVQAMTKEMLEQEIECWDEFTEEYTTIDEAFEPVVEEVDEPSDEELKKIELQLDAILFPIEEEF